MIRISRAAALTAAICWIVLTAPVSRAAPPTTAASPASRAPDRAALSVRTDALTRYIHLTYRVPPDAPDEVRVRCTWSQPGEDAWRPARVTPLLSETGQALVSQDEWRPWVERGELIERRAAGLERTAVFHPYPEAQTDGRVDIDFRIELETIDGNSLSQQVTRVQADNSDVVCVEDWSRVYQADQVQAQTQPAHRKWSWRTNVPASMPVSLGNGLWGHSEPDVPLEPLTYPLDLKGWYAIFVATVPGQGGLLRLSGDERGDVLVSPRPRVELFWRYECMDRQDLIFRQMHWYTGWADAQIDYVRLVPLSAEQVDTLRAPLQHPPDKFIAGFYEPFSWGFLEKVYETLRHREPLVAFRAGRVGLVDIQISRFCDKAIYESRVADRLLYDTFGDPIGNVARPETPNAGKMQQYTNTLDAALRYARELGMAAHANFGAGACYVGTEVQGDITKQHPEYLRDRHHFRYELPEVRQFALSLCREALEIGAGGISIDFCRYPEVIDAAETANQFLRELRKLTSEFSAMRGERIRVLARFPGTGVRLADRFDYTTWVREGLVDYLCPSNIQGRHMHIDVAPYLEAVRGAECLLLPCVDGLPWAPEVPGAFLWRVRQLYEAGVPGLYIYQADSRVMSRRPSDQRCMALLASHQAVRDWWREDDRLRPARSKNIYISRPLQIGGYHSWERLRAWVDGIEMGELEFYLDGRLVNRCIGPPYLLGTEDYASDRIIPSGSHTLKIRVKDGDGWLEKTFTIQGA